MRININTPSHSKAESGISLQTLAVALWAGPGSNLTEVRMSATISSVAQYCSFTVAFPTCSRMKWYLIPVCLARPQNCGFLARQMAHWLSSKILVRFPGRVFRSVSNYRIQKASCASLANAMHSALAVESATHVCFLTLQLITAPLVWNIYPDVDLQSSVSPALSKSGYPTHSFDPSFFQRRPRDNMTIK